MSYITNTYFFVRDKRTGEKLPAGNKSFEAVHKALNDNWGVNDKLDDSIYIEFHHSIGEKETEILKALTVEHPDILIEINGEGEGQCDLWSSRVCAGKIETVHAEVVYPSFQTITLPQDEPKKKSIEQRLQECVDTIIEIKGSGYWPFASPHPCSTERNIKKGIYQALQGLETALYFHQTMFGKDKDCMNPPQTVIKQVK
jgi:hypothetical protein